MRRPFGKLVEMCQEALDKEPDTRLGDLAYRWDEPIARIEDAIDTLKILRGEPGYIGLSGE